MLLNVSVIITKKKGAVHPSFANLEIGGKYEESISLEIAKSLIDSYGLKKQEEFDSIRSKIESIDIVYS